MEIVIVKQNKSDTCGASHMCGLASVNVNRLERHKGLAHFQKKRKPAGVCVSDGYRVRDWNCRVSARHA